MNKLNRAIASFLTTFALVGVVAMPIPKVQAQTLTTDSNPNNNSSGLEQAEILQGIEANTPSASNWQFSTGGTKPTSRDNSQNPYQMRRNTSLQLQRSERESSWGNTGEPRSSGPKFPFSKF